MTEKTCLCGCGGVPKGTFLRGHNNRVRYGTPTERFWAKVNKTETCWLWTSSISPDGYGRFHLGTKGSSPVAAHRWAYEQLIGPIPEGLVTDHLCRVRHCVNPSHIEPVTNRENLIRGIAARRQAND